MISPSRETGVVLDSSKSPPHMAQQRKSDCSGRPDFSMNSGARPTSAVIGSGRTDELGMGDKSNVVPSDEGEAHVSGGE